MSPEKPSRKLKVYRPGLKSVHTVKQESASDNLDPNQDKLDKVSDENTSLSVFKKYSGLFSLLQLIVGAVILAFFINQFIFHPYEVYGESMTPTLQNGDRLIVSRVGRTWNSIWGREYTPKRGDIIVFKSTLSSRDQLVKRVIALPGERVLVKDGKLTVFNDEYPEGFNPDEAYSDLIPSYTTGNIDTHVNDGFVFVSGDNRGEGGSLDSRNELGQVPIDNIVGELVLRIFPLSDAQFF
jgi:signal peptidase I